jgi:Holliday junction resolvasome RuvABC endonuclease subunit
MHSERVTRHCKGINKALTDLKQRFTDLSDNHDQLLVKYRQDVEGLETVFINATRTTKSVL